MTEEERLGELLRLLAAPPEHLVESAARLPEALGPPRSDDDVAATDDDPPHGDDPAGPPSWPDPGLGDADPGGAGDDPFD